MAVSIDSHVGYLLLAADTVPHCISRVRAHTFGALTILIYLSYTIAQVGNTRLAGPYWRAQPQARLHQPPRIWPSVGR